ncbi:MAG TPA: hypothetical protein VFT22_36130 [Kofleriaceae bacterium]|nr:hypothetical protein [Kofleriaceae bacterium]
MMLKPSSPMIALLVLASCASTPEVPAVRFANAPAVRVVDDRRDVAAKPSEREFIHSLYHYDGVVQRRLTRAMELPRDRRSLAVNALDEVPDSTWFTNRIGVRDLTLDELRAGPAKVGSPEAFKPWTVRSTRIGGSEHVLMITDARGRRFMLKFDSPEFPEQETATHVIVGKLLWACGYNVTEDHVVYFRPAELTLAEDAVGVDILGDKHPLGRAELDDFLRMVATERDGRIRALASLWLDGKPLGGPPAEGVREDDPNDRIPHQLRRDLRGAYPIFAWLDHVDIQESNFLDTWVEEGGRHYVKHYMLDFGKGLGVMDTTGHNPRHGHEYVVDFAEMIRSLATGGLVERTWEGRELPGLRGVGMFGVKDYDPGEWKPDSPAYVPLLNADRIDKFWGAKILIRFTREQIHAVVETARLSDPRAVEYLTDTLVARQRATARYWFERTNPLDRFEIAAGAGGVTLCFDDLTLVHGLAQGAAAATRYGLATYDAEGRALAEPAGVPASATGRTCSGALTLSGAPGGYTIVRVAMERGDFRGETLVHIARNLDTGVARVIGVWRP